MADTPSIDSEADLEAEWGELGRGWFGARDGERPSLWFFPVLLLYTGMFFGPFATALAAVFTLRARITLRIAAIVMGACGAAWCLLQGVSMFNGAWWSELQLQSMRSTVNFAAGIVAYVVVRPTAITHYRQSLRTLGISTVVIILAIVAFLLLPPTLLVAMGR